MPNTTTITATSSASAIPTVGGQNIASPLRLRVGDNDSANYEFPDSDLLLLLAHALRAYQDERPYTLSTTITTVAEQSDYVLPSSCQMVVSHDYRVFAGISADAWVSYFDTLAFSPTLVPFRDWSDDVLNRVRTEYNIRFDQMGAGQAEVVDYQTSYASTKYLRLTPTPKASGDTFTVKYFADHPIQNNDYFTIPSSHALLIQKLLEAEVYDVRANKMSSTATDFGAGTSRIKFDKAIDALRNRASALRQEVSDALRFPVGAIG